MLSRYIRTIIGSAKSRSKASGLNRRLNGLDGLIFLSTVIVIITTTGLAVNTIEIAPDISIIKMLPANYNPYQKLYDEMLYPTVRIESESGIGSGVIINRRDAETAENIYILSAAHVVGNQSVVTVTIYTPLTPLNRGELSLSASVVITDTIKDLALLKILCVSAVHTAKLAKKNYVPYLFTPVYAVGCSLGLDPRPSFGHLCALGELGGEWEISAPILPGNSGGPVFSADTHELIGIVVWVKVYRGQLVTTMAGIVPVTEIYKFLNSINHKVHKEH